MVKHLNITRINVVPALHEEKIHNHKTEVKKISKDNDKDNAVNLIFSILIIIIFFLIFVSKTQIFLYF